MVLWGSLIETSQDIILEDDHPYLLPICKKDDSVECRKFEVRFERLQRLLEATVKEGHVVVGYIAGNCQDPVDYGVGLLVGDVVPVGGLTRSQLIVRVDQG